MVFFLAKEGPHVAFSPFFLHLQLILTKVELSAAVCLTTGSLEVRLKVPDVFLPFVLPLMSQVVGIFCLFWFWLFVCLCVRLYLGIPVFFKLLFDEVVKFLPVGAVQVAAYSPQVAEYEGGTQQGLHVLGLLMQGTKI